MDALHLMSAWSKSGINSPRSITVKNLLLQGAELQGTHLVEADDNAPEIILLPPLVLAYSQGLSIATFECLKIPLYHNITREAFLIEISLPIREDADIWILAGVAIFLAGT